MYVVTRADLPPGTQAVQGMHAAVALTASYRQITARDMSIVFLTVPDEAALDRLLGKCRAERIQLGWFYEEDLNWQLTAVAFTGAPWLVRSLPLALQEKKHVRVHQ
jgi:hypothetical protein